MERMVKGEVVFDRFVVAEAVSRLRMVAEAEPSMKPYPCRIPIVAAKRIAVNYGYDQIVVMARKTGEGGMEHVTTYGVSREHCVVAEKMGNALKRVMQWPESEIKLKPRGNRAAEAPKENL